MEVKDYVDISVATFSALVVIIVILQIIYIQSKLSNESDVSMYHKGSDHVRLPFGVYAVYVDDVKTFELNKSKIILPSVSVTYYSGSDSIPFNTSYIPTNYYILALRDTDSSQSLKLMLKTNNANYVVIAKSLYGVMLHRDQIVLYTPMRTSAKDVLNIVSFAGASTDATFAQLKTLSSAIPVHVLAYKV